MATETMRVGVSTPPPAGQATTTRIGRFGYSAWAPAAPGKAPAPSKASRPRRVIRP